MRVLKIGCLLVLLSACGQRGTSISPLEGRPSVFSQPENGNDVDSETAEGGGSTSEEGQSAECREKSAILTLGANLVFESANVYALVEKRIPETQDRQKNADARFELDRLFKALRDIQDQTIKSENRPVFAPIVKVYAFDETDPEMGTQQISALGKCGIIEHVSLGLFQNELELKKRVSELLETVKAEDSDHLGEEENASAENGQKKPENGGQLADTKIISAGALQEMISSLPAWNNILWWPVPSLKFNSHFGYRVHPVTKQRHLHSGSDLKALYGQVIQASATGVVIKSDFYRACGNRIVVQGGSTARTSYCHLSESFVQVGDKITPQSLIGRVGSSGRVTGPHLHLELKVQDALKNPKPYLKVRPTAGSVRPRYKEKDLAIIRYR